ncbi:hypothetical protein GCM10023091_23130 [Ravibacter arvi]|uniref:Uncharacterized protein n=2 Tax=Ravibacter arvi TaxID=2051041 RepID=A0ABP8LZY7_9BACT
MLCVTWNLDYIVMLNTTLFFVPSRNEIHKTIKLLREKLASSSLREAYNEPTRIGYEAALHILKNRIKDYSKVPILELSYTKSRAIALLAVDYLNGACDGEILLKVPYIEV